MNGTINNFASEGTSELSNNIYLLASLQRRFIDEENASPGTFIEVKSINAPREEPVFISLGTQSEQPVNQITWFTSSLPQSYLAFNQPLQDFALMSDYSVTLEEQLELEIARKLKNFEQVREIYIRHNEELTIVKVILDVEHYDYNLMDRIFNKAEFPIKDSFLEKLISFEYIPYYPESNNLINPKEDKLMFNKVVQENLSVKKGEDSTEFDDYLTPEKSFDYQNAKFIYA